MLRTMLFFILAASIIAMIIDKIKKIPIEYFFLSTELKEEDGALKDIKEMKEEFFKKAGKTEAESGSGCAKPEGALQQNSPEECAAYKDSVPSLSSSSRPIRFLRLSFPSDVMFAESMFQCAGIPYHAEFTHLPNVMGGMGCFSFNATNIYILEEDYEDALILMEEYIASKKNCGAIGGTKEKAVKKAVTIFTGTIFTGYYIPERHDTLGIIIYKRENSYRQPQGEEKTNEA